MSNELSPAVQAILAKLPKAGEDGTAPMLPPECYTSAEFFEFEKAAVFGRSWICVGREEQIAKAGDYLAPNVAGEPLLVVRNREGAINAMSAVCQHRGQVIACENGSTPGGLRCPLHFWTYDLNGRLMVAPRTPNLEELRAKKRLQPVRFENWHGFLFVNLDAQAAPLAPSLAKLEPFWENYKDAGLIAVPPKMADTPLPWNWKVHAENFTDAYHPEFVHRGTHDFAPSNHADGGVEFTPFKPGDNAIVRSVPLLKANGGMMEDGWGEVPMFPPIPNLSDKQRKRLTFALIPPSMTLIFAPGAVSYQLVSATGVTSIFASNDRVTAGGWLLPKSTIDLPDFTERTSRVREGAKKIWLQDIPVNLGVQQGKNSRFMPDLGERDYVVHLERTLLQFNAWLLSAYQAGAAGAGRRQVLRSVSS